MSDTNTQTIDAMPTKALFIEMLTRDIKLIPSVVDLLDNCVDGAIRLRGSGSFKDLWVRARVSSHELRIADNCGGIEADLARKYAFRFGRPEDAPFLQHSIGKFGVGMKRAFFKIGKHFRVESQARTSRFVVDVSVDEWARDEKKWEFKFDDVKEGIKGVSLEKRGTTIIVTRLHRDVAVEFRQQNFQKELKTAIETHLQEALSRGLKITLNEIPLGTRHLEMLSTQKLAPARKTLVFRKFGKPVRVNLYCGLGERDRNAAGWHVFCNGRLVLEADKTEVTGWGPLQVTGTPRFHPQYNMFRGYAYFDCDDAGRLPWNTTKTGIDTDNQIYRAVRPEMTKLMRPVIDFLNRLKEEKDRSEKGPLQMLVSSASPKPVQGLKSRAFFEMPRVPRRKPGPQLQKIQYEKPLEKVLAVQDALKVRTPRQVGEGTFEYFYNNECKE